DHFASARLFRQLDLRAGVLLNPTASLSPSQRKPEHNAHTPERAGAVVFRLFREEGLNFLAINGRDLSLAEMREHVSTQCIPVVIEGCDLPGWPFSRLPPFCQF